MGQIRRSGAAPRTRWPELLSGSALARNCRFLGVVGGLAALGLAQLLSCNRGQVAAQVAPNVLVIVVDTLRWDRLGSYGAKRDTSPAMDALAEESILFERAYATAPWTKPSIGSMLTGLHPSTHGGQTPALPLPEEAVTLAEILGANGWATFGVVSSFVVSKRNGFAQGFERYDQSAIGDFNHVSTKAVSKRAIAALDALARDDRPFFLFVHYFDPHYNYRRHAELGFAAESAGRLDGTQSMDALLRLGRAMEPEELTLLRDLYDEEIRHTDVGIGQLTEHLRATGLWDDTIVILTSDHGEEFLDHGQLGHTHSLYEELIRVPLLLRAPGRAPSRVARPVSLLGLTPTVLDLLGVEADRGDLELQGHSWLQDGEQAGEQADGDSYLLSEVDFETPGARQKTAFKKALVGRRYKLIRDDRSGEVELFDLELDPRESGNLAAAQPDLVQELLSLLDERIRAAQRVSLKPEQLDLDEAELEMLRGLGYIESE